MNYKDFLSRIKEIKVIDTHEHIGAERDLINQKIDAFSLFVPYICDNLISAGMGRNEWAMISNMDTPFEDRWKIFEPYMGYIKFSTYFQALFGQLKDRYGIKNFTLEEAKKVNLKLLEENVAGIFDKIKQEYNIEATFSFLPYDYDSILYARNNSLNVVPTVSDICIRSIYDIERLEKSTKIIINNFSKLIKAIDELFYSYKKIGIKAIKFGSAYRRKLDFNVQTQHEAENVFLKVFYEKVNGDSKMCGLPFQVLGEQDVKILDDYLTEYMISLAEDLDFKVFFHTGLHAWNENNIEATRAFYLEGLIRRHKKVSFILLHCGIPFVDEAVLLCKYFSNVHLNMTWCHIIDRQQSKQLVIKIVEMLPLNKIHGFGGDYIHPIQIGGHLKIAYENIAEGLWHFVERGIMNEDEAVWIAKLWLYENPKKLLDI